MNCPFTMRQMFTVLRRSIQPALTVALVCALVCILLSGASAQQVLVAGGATSCNGNGCTYTASAEVFDPSTMSWTPTSNDIQNPPPSGLCDANLALLGNGTVLLSGGGCSSQGDTTNAASLYSPSANMWTATTFMNHGRDQFGMVTLNGGNALAFAGCSGACTEDNGQGQHFGEVAVSAEIYNFQNAIWADVADLNVERGNLEVSNVNQDAVVLQDGRVLTCNGSDAGNQETNTCEIYDPNANSWTLTGPIGGSNELRLHELVLLPNGQVLTVLNDGLSASLFDPTSGTWGPTGSLATVQIKGHLARLSDGRVLDCGGQDVNGMPISTAQIYDPATGQWSPTGSMTTARYGHIDVVLSDGTVLVAGGTDSNLLVVSSAEIFNPSTGTWIATVPMTVPRSDANAVLISGNYALAVSISGGTDSGTVTSVPGGINCPNVCSHLYTANTVVMLNASPASGWTFVGWSGSGCSGTGSCTVTMNQSQSVTATFSQQTYQLTVSPIVNGGGSVTSAPAGINCPGTCGNSYPAGTPVTLTATAIPGWTFTGWSGGCSGTGTCQVIMSQDQSVTATFTQLPNNYVLSVSVNGSGNVTSNPGNISCPGICGATYASGQQVTLTATPSPGGSFSGWSGGGCSGSVITCQVTMTQNLSVTAVFTGQQDLVMHSFGSGNGDGQNPTASLIRDANDNLFGTTPAGGLNHSGTVFEVANGTETVLYNFGGGNGDGQTPLGKLTWDSSGNNLFGTTSAGGTQNKGTVFELSKNQGGGWTETVLYNFSGADGETPSAGLVFDSLGNLYGTTTKGGTFGLGTAFELTPGNGGGWTETALYSFGSIPNDGQNPASDLVFDNSGTNLYGTTVNGGGTGCGGSGCGTVFELLPDTRPNRCCREAPVYIFGGSDGQNPYAGVIFDAAGNLYGTTAIGGANSLGTAFELSSGNGGWTQAFLYSFAGSTDGENPYGGLIFDHFGNLYGTTAAGGLYAGGTVFELLLSNGRCCRENPVSVYSFGSTSFDGNNPRAGLIFDSTGILHGTSVNGGGGAACTSGCGTVFGVTPGAVPAQFVPVAPCRIVDTRNANGTFGGPAIAGHSFRSFPLSESDNPCGIPADATAYSLNVTAVTTGHLAYLTIWPSGQPQPTVSIMNSPDGRTKANAAIVPAGASGGAVSVYVTDTTNVILDINGYFTTSSGSALEFYPLTPCRLVDTRGPNGNLGGPALQARQERDFPLLQGACGLPDNAAAYSLNFTVLPKGPRVGYLTVWPTGETQPPVSTLNDPTGTNVANAALIPAGTDGAIATYATDDTDLLVDVNGYFAPAGSGGLSLYTLTPCRVLDTRMGGSGQPFSGELTVNVQASPCGLPTTAQGYVFNATAIPNGALNFLTLWPDTEQQPTVSTLNARDGAITSNMAIVPNVNGQTDVWAQGSTHLILDISGYFAP